jgi:hypothetical protein
MTKKKLTYAEQLVNILTPYVVQPESGTAEFVIHRILQYLIDNFYEYFPELQDEDEFYEKLYGSHGKIEVEILENLITQLQYMETTKKTQFEKDEID